VRTKFLELNVDFNSLSFDLHVHGIFRIRGRHFGYRDVIMVDLGPCRRCTRLQAAQFLNDENQNDVPKSVAPVRKTT